MRSLTVGLSLVIVLIAAPARAGSFTLSSLKVDLNQRGTALKWTNLLGESLSFDLNAIGQFVTVNLFQLSTKESSPDLRSLVSPHPIDVGLTLTSPSPGFSGSSFGLTGAGSFLHGVGQLVWTNPVQLSFGNGGLLALSLSNATFGLPGSAAISATFTLLQNSPSPTSPSLPSSSPVQVPEFFSALLVALGGGLFAMVRALRAHA